MPLPCPKCKETIPVERGDVTTEVSCVYCGHKFLLGPGLQTKREPETKKRSHWSGRGMQMVLVMVVLVTIAIFALSSQRKEKDWGKRSQSQAREKKPSKGGAGKKGGVDEGNVKPLERLFRHLNYVGALAHVHRFEGRQINSKNVSGYMAAAVRHLTHPKNDEQLYLMVNTQTGDMYVARIEWQGVMPSIKDNREAKLGSSVRGTLNVDEWQFLSEYFQAYYDRDNNVDGGKKQSMTELRKALLKKHSKVSESRMLEVIHSVRPPTLSIEPSLMEKILTGEVQLD